MHHHPRLRRRKDGERGASLVEYALLVALIAVVCIVAVTFVGTSGSSKFDKAGKAVEGGASSTTAPRPFLISCYGGGGNWTGTYSNGQTLTGTSGSCPMEL